MRKDTIEDNILVSSFSKEKRISIGTNVCRYSKSPIIRKSHLWVRLTHCIKKDTYRSIPFILSSVSSYFIYIKVVDSCQGFCKVPL